MHQLGEKIIGFIQNTEITENNSKLNIKVGLGNI